MPRFLKFAAVIFTIASVLLANFMPFVENIAHAEGAALGFSPESGTQSVGKNFTVKVTLDSGGGAGVNAADGTVSFDPAYLTVSSVTKDGSVFSLWTSDPAFSNSNGTITFSGGSPSAYTRSGGTVVTINFRAKAAGTAELTFSSASVLAADGKGTNVLSGTKKASFNITSAAAAPEPEAPKEETPSAAQPSGEAIGLTVDIASNTHPDPDKWYANKNPEFKWKLPPDVAGLSTAFTQGATDAAPRTTEGVLEDKKFDNVADGVWYFHLRLRSSAGAWTATMHRKVQVDTTAPDPWQIEVHQDDKSASPQLGLKATDKTSGLDKFEIRVDDRDPVVISPEALNNGLYAVPPLLPGKHKVVVKAIDRAGNVSEASHDFEIEGASMPQILTYPGTLDEREFLIVEGTADRGAKVIMKIEKDGKVVAEESLRSDEDGRWVYAYRKHLDKGLYLISAKMITRAGAESGYTEKVELKVNGAPFVEKYAWILIMLFLFAITGLGILVWHERRGFLRQKELVRRETDEIKQKTEAVFSALTEEAEEKMELMDEHAAAKLGTPKLSAEDVLDKLRDALDISHDTIAKEIEDVEKALE